MMKKQYYHWLVCLCGTLAMFCCMGMASVAFSIHLPYMVDLASLSQTNTSFILTLRYIGSTLGLLVLNRILSRTGVRKMLAIAFLIGMAGFFLYSISSTFPAYCICSLLLGVSYAFGGDVTVSLLVVRWFESRKGLALGLASFGSGMATVIIPPVVTAIAEAMSIRAAFRAEAVIFLVLGVLIVLAVRSDPQEIGLAPYRTGTQEETKIRVSGKQTAPVPVLVAVSAASAIFGLTSNAMVGNYSLHFSLCGLARDEIPLLISVYGLTLAVGKLLLGVMCDRFGTVRSVMLEGALLTAGSFLCAGVILSGSVLQAGVSTALLGLGFPIGFIGMSVYASDFASKEDYARVLKYFKISYMLGALLFSPVPGITADIFGDYGFIYTVMSVLNTVGILMVLLTYRQYGKMAE